MYIIIMYMYVCQPLGLITSHSQEFGYYGLFLSFLCNFPLLSLFFLPLLFFFFPLFLFLSPPLTLLSFSSFLSFPFLFPFPFSFPFPPLIFFHTPFPPFPFFPFLLLFFNSPFFVLILPPIYVISIFLVC